jgi:dihydrofolate reductase
MGKTVYRTATSLDGYIADTSNSLAWLFAVSQAGDDDEFDVFMDGVGTVVEGSTTYEWVLREQGLLAEPEKWALLYGTRPVFVLTSRELPRPVGADVRFLNGSISEHLSKIRLAAARRDIWVVGGGDVAGQFLDVNALDEIFLTVAPAFLTDGAPLLPRRIESDRLKLRDVSRRQEFVDLRYSIDRR